jgi:signal peptidase I
MLSFYFAKNFFYIIMENMGKTLSFFFELLKTVLLALAIVLPIRFFIFEPFVVKGTSMEPNFHQGDYLIIDKLSFRFRPPQRGEVIIFNYPLNPKQRFIKRIIGLPGEKVQIKEGRVEINGKPLQERYLPENILTPGELEMTIPENQYFVLGDNRLSSLDSRQWGSLPRRNIVGRVLFDLRFSISFPYFSVKKISSPLY